MTCRKTQADGKFPFRKGHDRRSLVSDGQGVTDRSVHADPASVRHDKPPDGDGARSADSGTRPGVLIEKREGSRPQIRNHQASRGVKEITQGSGSRPGAVGTRVSYPMIQKRGNEASQKWWHKGKQGERRPS